MSYCHPLLRSMKHEDEPQWPAIDCGRQRDPLHCCSHRPCARNIGESGPAELARLYTIIKCKVRVVRQLNGLLPEIPEEDFLPTSYREQGRRYLRLAVLTRRYFPIVGVQSVSAADRGHEVSGITFTLNLDRRCGLPNLREISRCQVDICGPVIFL